MQCRYQAGRITESFVGSAGRFFIQLRPLNTRLKRSTHPKPFKTRCRPAV
jgi:hypothetical protein